MNQRRFPDWCCKAPDGGVHVDARVGAADLQLSRAPTGRDEFSWNCDFQVWIVLKEWLKIVEDLVDDDKIALGQVMVDGQTIKDWATIHEAQAPEIFSPQGWSKVCPICGYIYSMLRGAVFFTDASIVDRPLIVTNSGIFVREDEALSRDLRKPAGAFKPTRVGLKQSR